MDWLRELAVSGVEAGWLSDSFSYAFMVNAIVAALILGPLLGGLGTLVIAKRLAFFSEAVGHAALTGIAIGVLLGEPPENPIIGLFSFCMIFALLLHFVRNRTNVPYDTLVGGFSCTSVSGWCCAVNVRCSQDQHSHVGERVVWLDLDCDGQRYPYFSDQLFDHITASYSNV